LPLRPRLELLGTNRGFAYANNLGARIARGQWLVLLNADAFPDPAWLEELLRAAEASPPGTFFASRQIQWGQPDLLDGEGDEYHVSGLAWRRNYGARLYPARGPQEVFSACAAAAMYPRAEFVAAGGFDEDFFAYLEDVDLGFRLRLRGLRCSLVPSAVVHHVGTASTGLGSDFAVYHGHRNLVWTFVKDMPASLLWLNMPLAVAMNIFYVLSFTFRGRGRVIFRAKWDALRGLPAILQKRRAVQAARVVEADAVHRCMQRGILAPLRARRLRLHPQ
jgi:GT2 family glycosyltransferase